jgi:hypothetical protein
MELKLFFGEYFEAVAVRESLSDEPEMHRNVR